MESLSYGSHRLVHLDMKGAPPKVQYIEKLFPYLRDQGATGLLLEWEDTFPYTRELRTIGGLSESAASSNSPYSIQEAMHIMDIADECGLLVIPLIQTMGHMEFVLKYPEWSSLREVENFPSSMCPSHPEALGLVQAMLRQVISLHRANRLDYIHIGADEVWHMGLCASCSRRAAESKYGRAVLFLDHITSVARFLKETHPHLKIIMWDDMMRNIDLKVLQDYDMGSLVEPMVWHYYPREHFQLGPQMWEKYGSIFPKIWVASAYKGATGSCQVMPIMDHHIGNHEAWMNEIEQHGSKIQRLMGIAFTGWSRYDHYATLCELLPTGLPVLSVCLRIWRGGSASPSVVCASEGPPEGEEFPGWQVMRGVVMFIGLRDRYRNIVFGDQVQTWLNQWQVQTRYTNPMQIQSLVPVINELLNEINSVQVYLHGFMEQIFFHSTLEEWIGTNIVPMRTHLLQIKSDTEFQLSMGCCIRNSNQKYFCT